MKLLFSLLTILLLACGIASASLRDEMSPSTKEFLAKMTEGKGKQFFATIKEKMVSMAKEKLQSHAQFSQLFDLYNEQLEHAKDSSSLRGALFTVPIVCPLCHLAVSTLDSVLDSKVFLGIVNTLATKVCEVEQSYDVCHGAVTEFSTILMTSLTSSYFSPKMACSYFYPACAYPKYEVLTHESYQARVFKNKPASVITNNYVDSLYKAVNADQQQRKTYKVLHITDPHIDFEYKAGTNANCGAPICCREASGQPPVQSDAAGPWGDYRCDVPINTVNVMFDYIQEQYKPDLIFWTGDNVPHNVWAQSVQENTDATLKITAILKDKFPQAYVVPVVGNHEPFPVNAINFNDKDSFMLNAFADAWADWIPADQMALFRRYGYYQVKIPQSITGAPTRIIGLHTNACNNMDFYYFARGNDPAEHLKWLEQVLQNAEADGESVVIIGHIPPVGGDCLTEWSYRYRALCERYQDVIRGQYFGHQHLEKFYTIRSVENSLPIGTVHLTGSLTTETNNNPNFRIFEIDQLTNLPISASTYIFNITEANLNPDTKPTVHLAYEMKQEYGMQDLSPQSFDYLSERLLHEEDLSIKYLWNQHGKSTVELPKSCNLKCRNQLYCETRNSINYEASDCMGEPRLDPFTDPLGTLFELTVGPWFVEVDPHKHD